MAESNTTDDAVIRCSTPHASLAALGLKLRKLDLFRPIRERVHIEQKTVLHTPTDKLYDAFVGILAGAHGLVEINTRLRSDPALQRAFGRQACAEQSVVQDTLDASDETSVAQMEAALDEIFRRHSRAYRHDYHRGWQLLDVDMSSMPSGPKAAFATPGYFARQRQRRGRQLGRVFATSYQEVVVDRLFAGKEQLRSALCPLVEAAEGTLRLDNNKAQRRRRTIVRVDAGGGTLADINWLLRRGYEVHAKDYSPQRVKKLVASVTTWVEDPRTPSRQVGWVTLPTDAYERPVRRIAVRCRKRNGQWAHGVLISTLVPELVLALTTTGQSSTTTTVAAVAAEDPTTAVMLAYVYFYDKRGGGVETANKEDKQGLGITKRTKKREAAQRMVVYLGTLAHNVLVWARAWLSTGAPRVRAFGIKRLVRDVMRRVHGVVEYDSQGRVGRIVLHQAHCFAHWLVTGLQTLVGSEHVVIISGET